MAIHDNPNLTPDISRVAVVSHFDEAAATWDENPRRLALTEAIARGVVAAVPLQPDWRAMEYGCGTAVLSFLLASRVREVVAADASPGMVDQVRRKLERFPGARILPRLLDLTQAPAPDEQYDLILAAMTLHHVEDVPTLLTRLGSMLRNGGWLIIADLQTEDGSFHTALTVPHHGFEPAALVQNMNQALGTQTGAWRVVYEFPKNDRIYPVCLWTAQKA